MSHLTVPVIAAPLMDPERMRITLEVPAGLTVAQIVQLALPGAGVGPDQLRVTLVSDQGAAVVRRGLWHCVRPNPGVQVILRGIPGDDALRTVLLIAVSAAALAFAPAVAAGIGLSGQFATSLVAAGLTVVGTLLVNALIPLPVPDSGTQRDVYQISGWRNEIRPGQPVPLILGRHRYAPPFAATSWTEIVGDDQYVRALFCVGYGPVRISDIRIGDTSVDDYDDVTVEVREGRVGDAPVGLFPRQVLEEPFGVELVRPYPRDDKGDPITKVNTGGGVIGGVFGDDVPTIETPVERWTAADVSEVSVLIGFPAGLFRINDDAQIRSRTVSVRIRARLNGVGAWTEVETLNIRAKKRESFVRQFTWAVPVRGRYQVEVTRMSNESLETNRSDRTILAAIQSIRPEYPLNFDKPLALMAARIKATAQLNGALDAVNCIAEREGLVRDMDAWVPGYGRTPATAFLAALMGPSNPYPVFAPGDYEYWVEAFDADGRAGALDGPHPVTVTAAPPP